MEKGYPLADLNVAMREDLKARKGTTQEHLTIDGVHMNYLGNLMMAKGVLRGFGLDDQQIAKAYDAWLDTPGAWPLTVTLNVSLRERETLRALAESQNKDLQSVLSQAFKTSVTPLLQSAQPTPGK